MLFLYAKLNPGIRYVQGMNEVPHPILSLYPSTICDVLYLLAVVVGLTHGRKALVCMLRLTQIVAALN